MNANFFNFTRKLACQSEGGQEENTQTSGGGVTLFRLRHGNCCLLRLHCLSCNWSIVSESEWASVHTKQLQPVSTCFTEINPSSLCLATDIPAQSRNQKTVFLLRLKTQNYSLDCFEWMSHADIYVFAHTHRPVLTDYTSDYAAIHLQLCITSYIQGTLIHSMSLWKISKWHIHRNNFRFSFYKIRKFVKTLIFCILQMQLTINVTTSLFFSN